MNCQFLGGGCDRTAKWKVPLFGEQDPHCLCDEHVKEWRESQPDNVKAMRDNTPWPSGRDSRVRPLNRKGD